MSTCLNCGHDETQHLADQCWSGILAPYWRATTEPCDCPGFRDEPTDSEMQPRSRPVDSFEGIGDFNSDDPYQRYLAHQAAKGR